MATQRVGPELELDVSNFPLVVMVERGPLSDRARVEAMEALDELLDRRGRHALVLDLTAAVPISERQRQYLAEHLQMRGDVIAEKWAAIAVLVRAPLLSHVALAAFWLKVSPVQAKPFTERESALRWARSCLAERRSGDQLTGGDEARAKRLAR